jgi:hypothetical protein
VQASVSARLNLWIAIWRNMRSHWDIACGFYQWQNFRQLFWEAELRTISQGHPDYRFIEQEKVSIGSKSVFP